MSRIRRLQPIIRLAAVKLEQAGMELLRAQQQVQAESQRLYQLQEYQLEYRQDMLRLGKAGITIGQVRLYDGFQHQLDQAIQHQQHVILRTEQQVTHARDVWQHLDMRHKSLQKVLERLEREAETQQRRIEQRNHDEYARRRVGDQN